MGEAPLIPTKLRAPRVTSPLVDRPRLTRRLEAHPGRVVLVTASAGFGKTVLVADWLASLTGPTAWLSLDGLDNDPKRFLAHLAAAVMELEVPEAERAARLIVALEPSGLPLPRTLLEALAAMGREPVIVLDDLHEIRSPEIMALIEKLVHIPGACPRLVLLTREDPPFATGRLRIGGELLEFRARDLRFTEDETIELFERLLPGVLDAAAVRLLDQRTEGWAAGLRLAAMALQDAEDPAAFVESFAGTHRFVMDYLLEEALERQAPAVQRFLMETSILGRFSRESCAAVTGDPDAAVRLDEVEAAGLFLVPLGGDGEWYRYHHLFADLLRFRLGLQQAGRLEELHRRASRWFQAEGDVPAALEQASRMEDQTLLFELLDGYALDMLGRSEIAALRHWIGQLREPWPQTFPMVLCAIGWVRVLTHRAPDLEQVLNRVSAALEYAPERYDPARRRRAALHIEVLSAYEARYAGRFEEALRVADAAVHRIMDDDPFTRGLLVYNTARVRMALADMAPACELLEQAFGDHLRAGNLYLTLASLGRSAAVVAQTEGVNPARESLAAAVTFAEERGLVGNGAFSIILCHRGSVEHLAGEVERAERWFRSALELARAKDFPEERGNALVGLARVATARHSFDEAEALLVDAAALAQGSNTDLFDTTLTLESARLGIARECAGAGPPVPHLEPVEDSGPWTTLRETQVTLAIGQAMRTERHADAALLIDELRQASARLGRGPAHCAALLAGALLPAAPDRWNDVEAALVLAATRGYVQPLLDGGAPVRGLLRAALSRALSASARAHAVQVLDAFDSGSVDEGPAERPPSGDQLLERLTVREEEVLACLFRGESNKAIARSLFVSVDTAKTHLKHIYAKLGVTDRNQAVARAGALGLTPKTGA